MLFLFNYIKLTFWLSLYYFKKGDPEIIEDIIIHDIGTRIFNFQCLHNGNILFSKSIYLSHIGPART